VKAREPLDTARVVLDPDVADPDPPDPGAVATLGVVVVVVVGLGDVVVGATVVGVGTAVAGGAVVGVVVGGAVVGVVVGGAVVGVVVGVTVAGWARERMRPAPDVSDPTARHAAVDGHARSAITPVTAGTASGAQVEPSSPLAKIWPPLSPRTTTAALRRRASLLVSPVRRSGWSRARSPVPARRMPAWRVAWPRGPDPVPPVKVAPPPPPRAASPDTKHVVVVGTQVTPFRGPAPGTSTACHVVPPLAVISATPLWRSAPMPTARQDVADWQLTPTSSAAAGAGTAWPAQLAPPSLVATICAVAPLLPRLPMPTATHVVAEPQLTEIRGPVLDGRARDTQVAPPSVVVRMAPLRNVGLAPTATHAVSEVQSIPRSSPVPLGRVCCFHVVPPSVVTATAPPSEPGPMVPTPTARQFVADGQSIPSNAPRLGGIVLAFHVVPPSVLVSTVLALEPIPSATHVVADAQLTSENGPVAVGRVPVPQVDPPSPVEKTSPNPKMLAPVTTQAVVEVQSTASRKPAFVGTV